MCRCPPSHAVSVLHSWYIKQIHHVEWLSFLNQLQTNCIFLSTVRSFLSYFIFSGKCERARWCLTKDRVVRFCPNEIPEHPFLSRQFLYIWLYHAFQWANSTPAAFTLTHKNFPLEPQVRFPRNSLVSEIVGRAQEHDLSVTGHPTVGKLLGDWSPALLWDVSNHPQLAHWPYLQSHRQPMQMADAFQQTHMCGAFASWIFQEGFLAHCSHQTLSFSHQTLSFSHLNKISPLGDAAISSFHPSLNLKLPEAVRQLISLEQDQLGTNISPQMRWVTAVQSACAVLEPDASSSHQGAQLLLGARALSKETSAWICWSSRIKNQLSRVSWACLLHGTFRKPVRRVVLTQDMCWSSLCSTAPQLLFRCRPESQSLGGCIYNWDNSKTDYSVCIIGFVSA